MGAHSRGYSEVGAHSRGLFGAGGSFEGVIRSWGLIRGGYSELGAHSRVLFGAGGSFEDLWYAFKDKLSASRMLQEIFLGGYKRHFFAEKSRRSSQLRHSS